MSIFDFSFAQHNVVGKEYWIVLIRPHLQPCRECWIVDLQMAISKPSSKDCAVREGDTTPKE